MWITSFLCFQYTFLYFRCFWHLGCNLQIFLIYTNYFIVGLANNDAKNPNTTAAAIPPAVAYTPPVKIPINPCSDIAFTVPLYSE